MTQVPANSERDLCAHSAAMVALCELARKVARSDISVILGGESGTGKEVLARYLHEQSPRGQGPFVAVNCAAIPESMLEAILFGHEKGSYTGASERRAGKFEQAHGGTLLLDEITEMPVNLQAKLLRVLQESEVERLGAQRATPIDVRVLATSNRDLTEAMAQGRLREDLYYRLSVFALRIPPLRERREDVAPLAELFLERYGAPGHAIDAGARALLETYEWPGNVRELENCIQRALVLADGEPILDEHLVLQNCTVALGPQDAGQPGSLQDQLRLEEEQLLMRTLAQHNGVRKATAKDLGISERTLRHKLQSMRERGIEIAGFQAMGGASRGN